MEIIGTGLQIYLLAVGGVLVAAALWLLRRWLRLLRVGARAPGEVIAWITTRATMDYSETHQPRVRFTDADGISREFISSFGFDRYPAVGSPVTVLFDPRLPGNAEVARPLWMTAGPLALAALGLAAIGAAVT